MKELNLKADDFADFLVCQKNIAPLALIRSLWDAMQANRPAPYNPLLLRGRSGTGKSHLAALFTEQLPCSSVLFSGRELLRALSSEQSASLFFDSIKTTALLAVDDIQYIFESEKSQQELCYIIDFFCKNNQIILMTQSMENGSPAPIPALQSRMLMGMTVELAEPDLDVRLRYAQTCFMKHNLKADRDYAFTLARRCGHLRAINGVILKIAAFRDMTGKLPDQTEVNRILLSTGSMPDLSAEAIITVVGTRYGFTPREIRSKKRDPRLVEARQIAMYLCRIILGESYPSLGRIFGGKDHSTVIYAIRKIEENRVMNKDMNILVTELTERCKNILS